jgi:diadenosine tetraphosphate (Ap4A) HIT family hydrolase
MYNTRDFLGHEWTYDCMGCAIADGSMQIPGGLIKQTEHFVVHQDPLIPLPGFLVIGARRHIHSLAEMTQAEYEEFASLLWTTDKAIRATTGVEYLTLVQEEHSIHFHLWFFPWTAQVLEKYGLPSLAKIRAIMDDCRKQSLNAEEWQKLKIDVDTIKQSFEFRRKP